MNMDIDYGREAHEAAEEHLEACWEALDAENEGEVIEWPNTAGPFCGCLTCQIRETLHAAWPHMELAVRAELETRQ